MCMLTRLHGYGTALRKTRRTGRSRLSLNIWKKRMLDKVTRDEAKKAGLKHYFTGKPCPSGHTSLRRVSSSGCVECDRERCRKYARTEKARFEKKQRLSDPEKRRRSYELDRKRRNPKYQVVKQELNIADGLSRDDYIREYHRVYYHHNKARRNEPTEEQKDKRKNYIATWTREKRKTPRGAAEAYMRKCVGRVLKSKKGMSKDLLGYTSFELVSHIEKQFKKGMSWDSRADWHIDHIVPISWFLNVGENDPKVINALTNLRPLWASENLEKSDKREFLI